MSSPERTKKGPKEFKNRTSFLKYCKNVALWLFKNLSESKKT